MIEESSDFLDGRGKIRFLEDRLEYHCKMEQSFGHPDGYINREIPYNSILNLETEPANILKIYDYIKRFSIYIPKIDKTIIFFVSRSRDSDVHPTHDESLHGPYLPKER